MLSKNQIKEIQSLHQKKQRDAKKLFVAEGVKTVNELIENKPELVRELFFTKDFVHSNFSKIKQLPSTEITEDELKKISLQSNPNQVLAICNYIEYEPKPFDFETHFSLYLDDIRDPGNFGTIVRLANWFGISTIFCSPSSCDFYNPKVIQASMGAFLRVNIQYIELTELVSTQTISHIFGTLLNGKNIHKTSLCNGLIVIGNEANGIKAENLKLIHHPITIPAHPNNGSESLNAALAASIVTAEFFRQLN